ncbi:protein-tyrosine phosphatase [Paenibacillus cellulosilyticus]|uniref:Tyrosine-protein phosphatase n=1 Tax=Paenibacillus cellulosilyticus TaxID=375489 RepID=A0A2V2YKM7_9BACL|nr:protein-tyrosine phosphatase [Paenibacillus cellulosilyticus]
MIEMHTHILPGLDDGARSKEEALEMALQASEQGIQHIVATPHHGNEVFEAPREIVLQHVEELNEFIGKHGVQVEIHAGQEIRVNTELINEWEHNKLLTLANSKYILLELPHNHVPDYFMDLLFELTIRGLVPVIAHPERNKAVVETPDLIEEWIGQGALCQLTAHSLTGQFSRRIQKLSVQLLKRKMIHFVSSDAHNCHTRAFALREAYRLTERVIGRGGMNRLKENSRRLLTNEEIVIEEPIKAKRHLLFW